MLSHASSQGALLILIVVDCRPSVHVESPLADLPRFRDLDALTVSRLVAAGEPVGVEAGQLLFRAGDPGDALYLVLAGRLEMHRAGVETCEEVGDGGLVGVLEVLSGEARLATVIATEPAELLRVPEAALDRVFEEFPDAAVQLVTVAKRRLLRRELSRFLPGLFGPLAGDAIQEIERMFRWFRLARGDRLFSQGDAGDALYLLVSGRLQAVVEEAGGHRRTVGEIVPGETVGEMALLTGEPRSASVVAVRDSVLQVCDRADFECLIDRHPQFLKHLSGILVRRLRQANQPATRRGGRMTLAVVPLHEGPDLRGFVDAFVRALEEAGTVLHLDGERIASRMDSHVRGGEDGLRDLRLLPWFEEQEMLHDMVVYEADPDTGPWTSRCARQADRIILVADADRDPAPGEIEQSVRGWLEGAQVPFHLVLLHPPDRTKPQNTRAWLDARRLARHHHVRRDRAADAARVARLVTGRGLGLVLSGGGARGLAHIGVVRALVDMGIPIDAIGGTSAGAALGCQYAMGFDWKEMRDATWREFVERRPFKSYTLPIYSLVGQAGIDLACRSVTGDMDIADLWVPFFCISCDLSTGEKVLHYKGPLWKAVRASISLPGIVPPVLDGRRLLVDGGVLDNVPEQEMKEFCGGPVIAVDVSSSDRIQMNYEFESLPSPWRVLWNRLNPFATPLRVPSLFEVMVRTATVSDAGQRAWVDEVADIVLRPPVGSFGLLEFSAVDAIVETSYAYSMEHLEGWVPFGE